MGFLNTIVSSVITTASRRRDLRLPVEGWWRLTLAVVFVIGGMANTPNPWGYVRDFGAFGQALVIVGILQIAELGVILIKANPIVFLSHISKRAKPRDKQ